MIHQTLRVCSFAFPPRPAHTTLALVRVTRPSVVRRFSHSVGLQRNLLWKYLPSLPRQDVPQNRTENEKDRASGSVSKDGRSDETLSVSSTLPLAPIDSKPVSMPVSGISPMGIPTPSTSSSTTSTPIVPSSTPLRIPPLANPNEIQARIPIPLPLVETLVAEKATAKDGDGPFEILGVKVPERPIKPGDEDCCMSGCAICVHDIYASAYQDYAAALEAARLALSQSTVPRTAWPIRVTELENEITHTGSGSDPLAGLDPGLKAFMELEARLKAGQTGSTGLGGLG